MDRAIGQDGNGASIPDSLWGIPLLGDGDGAKTIPTGPYTVGILSPSGIAGAGLVLLSLSPLTRPARLLQMYINAIQ